MEQIQKPKMEFSAPGLEMKTETFQVPSVEHLLEPKKKYYQNPGCPLGHGMQCDAWLAHGSPDDFYDYMDALEAGLVARGRSQEDARRENAENRAAGDQRIERKF